MYPSILSSNRSKVLRSLPCLSWLSLGLIAVTGFAAPGPGLQTLGPTRLFESDTGREMLPRFDAIVDFQTVSVTTRTSPVAPGQDAVCVYTTTGNFNNAQRKGFTWEFNDQGNNQSQWYVVLGPFPVGTRVTFKVEATGANGESLVDDNQGSNYFFDVIQAETTRLFSVSPNASTIRGNDVTFIYGQNFYQATRVYFGNQLATADRQVLSATTIRLRTPQATAVGPVNVSVVTPGQATQTLTLAYTYQVLGTDRPVPNELHSIRSVLATIQGTGTPLPATGGSITAAQRVVVTMDVDPPAASQPQWTTILWTTNNWTSWAFEELAFVGDFPGTPSVRRYTTTLPLFQTGQSVQFVVIAQCVSGGIAYKGATANTPFSFNVVAAGAPTVTNVGPSSVTFLGGQAAVVTGTNFTGGTTATVGGQPANVIIRSATTLRIITPPGNIGQQKDLSITVPGHAPINLPNAVTYSMIAPTDEGSGLAWVGDTRLFISGTATELGPSGGQVSQENTVSVITQAWPIAPGQTPWIVWSTDGFVTRNPDMMNFDFNTGNNTQYWEIIPAQQAGKTVQFFITITGQNGEARTDSNGGAYFSYTVVGQTSDVDGDGVPDSVEVENPDPTQPTQTNRSLPDCDLDGLLDGQEDANANGIVDSGETAGRKQDSDNDGVHDKVEILLGTNPLSAASPGSPPPDADGDKLPDSLDPNDAAKDADGDRYDDLIEAVQINIAAVTNNTVMPDVGDANQDGFVTNIDALIIQSFFIKIINESAPVFRGEGFKHTDINGDGSYTNLDALLAQSFFVQIVPTLPFPRL